MRKLLLGIGSTLLMGVLGLAVFMLFLVVPERESVEDSVVLAQAAFSEEEEAPPADNHARRNEDGTGEEEEEDSSAEASSFATESSTEDSAETDAENANAGAGTGHTAEEEDDTDTAETQTGRGIAGSAASLLTENAETDTDTNADDAVTALTEEEEDPALHDTGEERTRPGEGVATRERTTTQEDPVYEEEEDDRAAQRTQTVIENPTPDPAPVTQQSVGLNTGNLNAYLSVSVTDFGNGSYEARTAPVQNVSFSGASVSVTVRLTIDVVSDVRTVNGIQVRTRASMGRCQGGYCETRITAMIREELGKAVTDVRLTNGNSYMFTGYVKGGDQA